VSVTRTFETTADELTRGTLFAGRYEIIEELGTGGMGRVFLKVTRKIVHRNVCKMFDIGEAEGAHFSLIRRHQ
jgi:hypothetical protein